MSIALSPNSQIVCREGQHSNINHKQQQLWGNGNCLLLQRNEGYFWNKKSLVKKSNNNLLKVEAFWPESISRPTSVAMEPINDSEQLDQILSNAKEMAAWCRKCIYLKPKLEKLAAEYDTKFYGSEVIGYLIGLIGLLSYDESMRATLASSFDLHFMVLKSLVSNFVVRQSSNEILLCGRQQSASNLGEARKHICMYVLRSARINYYYSLHLLTHKLSVFPLNILCRGNSVLQKMPTIQLWKDGEMKAEVIGGHKAWLVVDEVREMIQKFI
ncbi:hypothetical protein ACFE04_030974 [Oxalis oulophora]